MVRVPAEAFCLVLSPPESHDTSSSTCARRIFTFRDIKIKVQNTVEYSLSLHAYFIFTLVVRAQLQRHTSASSIKKK